MKNDGENESISFGICSNNGVKFDSNIKPDKFYIQFIKRIKDTLMPSNFSLFKTHYERLSNTQRILIINISIGFDIKDSLIDCGVLIPQQVNNEQLDIFDEEPEPQMDYQFLVNKELSDLSSFVCLKLMSGADASYFNASDLDKRAALSQIISSNSGSNEPQVINSVIRAIDVLNRMGEIKVDDEDISGIEVTEAVIDQVAKYMNSY